MTKKHSPTTPSTSIQRRLKRMRCWPRVTTFTDPSSNRRYCRIYKLNITSSISNSAHVASERIKSTARTPGKH